MNRPSLSFLNFALFFLLSIIFACLQTALFHHFFDWHTGFQLVIVVVTYIAIYRKPLEGLIFVAVTSYAMGLLSSMMESVSFISMILLFIVIRMIRARVYTSGPAYFSWLTACAVLLFHVINLAVASLLEENPPTRAFFLTWILQVLFTLFFTRLCYHFFYWIDVKTNRDHEMELAG